MSDTRTSKAVNALYQKRPMNVPKETYKYIKRDVYMSDTRTSKAVSAFRGSLNVHDLERSMNIYKYTCGIHI